MQNFFDRFPRFLENSKKWQRRLRWRYAAIVEANRPLFDNARVLDLGSHDGRWSLAALDAGAAHVLGIEARAGLVEAATKIFGEYGAQRFRFVPGDVHDELAKLEPRRFDLILNLGFLSLTPRHYEVFAQMRRLAPRSIILDTDIAQGDAPLARYRLEETPSWSSGPIRPAAAPRGKGVGQAVVALPSHGLVRMLSEHFGFKLREVDWKTLGVDDWTEIDDYRAGSRRSYVLELQPESRAS